MAPDRKYIVSDIAVSRSRTLPFAAKGGYCPASQTAFFGNETMADHVVPHFQNDAGVTKITIGVKEFMCVGATTPFDHPHVFLDLGDADEKVCPYCSTLYAYDPGLAETETVPPGHLLLDKAA
jgi:uncharacterized Zn-finger protein